MTFTPIKMGKEALQMTNIIDIASKRQGKSNRLRYVINYVLSKGETLIVGTSRPQERYNELQALFPDANIEITEMGIKIWKK